MLDYHMLLSFMNEYISHYRDLLRFETAKLQLIFKDDIEGLDKSLSKEQALIMKTNSLEAKRFELLRGGHEKETFRELIDGAPPEYKNELSDQYKELCNLIFQIKKINDNAHEIVRKRLSVMENAENSSTDTYNKTGKKQRIDEKVTLNKGI